MYDVYLDPGHGGKDNGAVKYLVEDRVNLTEALACRDFLELTGYFRVHMSRSADTDTDLLETCADINRLGADIAVSFHNNAGGGDGMEIFYAIGSTKGKQLAACIEKRVKATGQNSRGLKTRKNSKEQDYFAFNRVPRCPSIILEGCFVDNKKDAADYDSIAEQQEYGYAVARGICDFFGVKALPTFRLNDTMNFRKNNYLKAPVLGTIPAGTLLTGTLLLDGWLKTTYEGKTGYVRVKGQKEYAARV